MGPLALGFEDLDVTDGANILTLNYEMDGTDVFICELGFADHFDYYSILESSSFR